MAERDVLQMHDYDNPVLSPSLRDIRTKDPSSNTEAFEGSLYIREKSMILIVIARNVRSKSRLRRRLRNFELRKYIDSCYNICLTLLYIFPVFVFVFIR